jgi:hypothetical protein
MRALIVLLMMCHTALASAHYTDAMFRRAMAQYNGTVTEDGQPLPPSKNDVERVLVGMSPMYVLITLQDPKNGARREICALNGSLEVAIASEHHLDLVDDERKIFDIAMAAPHRVFTFTRRKARQSVASAYTQEQLAYVRHLLEGRSRSWLLREAKVDLMKEPNQQGFVTRIYRHDTRKKFSESYPLRVAVAHVLLEHGILVGEAHYGGMLGVLYIDEKT